MDAAQIKATIQFLPYARNLGMAFKKIGGEYYSVCPFHVDKKPSFRVNERENTWFCDPCGKGGSIIDFVALKFNLSIGDAIKKLGGDNSDSKPIEVAKYRYTDENGKVLYEVRRYVPKTFRQFKWTGKEWQPNLQGVRRVLYNLPAVIASESVWVVEGEKDADSLNRIGYTATTNAGGAAYWLEAFGDYFKDKKVYVVPDSDKPGREHADKVIQSITGKAKIIFRVDLAEDKDITEFISRQPEGKAGEAVDALIKDLKPFNSVSNVPVLSMGEMEAEYAAFTKQAESKVFNLGMWLPSLGKAIRPIVPGEVIVIIGETGIGKTLISQHLAVCAVPVKTLIFELELPGSLLFERFLQMERGMKGKDVFDTYQRGEKIQWQESPMLQHIYVCTKSRMNVDELERIINESEMKIGEKPGVVIIDYIQLMQGKGSSRYERMSEVAERLKIVAKETNVIMIVISQISRKDEKGKEIHLHDAKDSGSIENSAGLVLGIWRDDKTMKIKVLKNTKGSWGKIVECEFNGALMQIREKPKISEEDVPETNKAPYKD